MWPQCPFALISSLDLSSFVKFICFAEVDDGACFEHNKARHLRNSQRCIELHDGVNACSHHSCSVARAHCLSNRHNAKVFSVLSDIVDDFNFLIKFYWNRSRFSLRCLQVTNLVHFSQMRFSQWELRQSVTFPLAWFFLLISFSHFRSTAIVFVSVVQLQQHLCHSIAEHQMYISIAHITIVGLWDRLFWLIFFSFFNIMMEYFNVDNRKSVRSK